MGGSLSRDHAAVLATSGACHLLRRLVVTSDHFPPFPTPLATRDRPSHPYLRARAPVTHDRRLQPLLRSSLNPLVAENQATYTRSEQRLNLSMPRSPVILDASTCAAALLREPSSIQSDLSALVELLSWPSLGSDPRTSFTELYGRTSIEIRHDDEFPSPLSNPWTIKFLPAMSSPRCHYTDLNFCLQPEQSPLLPCSIPTEALDPFELNIYASVPSDVDFLVPLSQRARVGVVIIFQPRGVDRKTDIALPATDWRCAPGLQSCRQLDNRIERCRLVARLAGRRAEDRARKERKRRGHT